MSKRQPCHKIYPYLLRGKEITRSNQVCVLDRTYEPMTKGFVYLTVAIAWAIRKLLAAKTAITLEASHAVDVLQQASRHHDTPEIINTNQGSQFTADKFVPAVKNEGCKLSMDNRGAWRDYVVVERLWKSAKCERVYLHTYDSEDAVRRLIMDYLD